jgi:hypothetical protein
MRMTRRNQKEQIMERFLESDFHSGNEFPLQSGEAHFSISLAENIMLANDSKDLGHFSFP